MKQMMKTKTVEHEEISYGNQHVTFRRWVINQKKEINK